MNLRKLKKSLDNRFILMKDIDLNTYILHEVIDMWVKTAFIYFLIVLDVMIFPFACSNNYRTKNYIFEIQIVDEEHEYRFYDEYVKKIPKNRTIDFPEDFIFEDKNYEIVGWYIYHDEDASKEDFVPELVSFPYKLQEEDSISFYYGYRNSVVFMAVWEYKGNASD
ncbi:MAG: hypothetical protein K2J93_04985 [Anaeroplasmataceae bacterium]|nr:hypothetical protein [Anaeroplasmataceae bacterium]